MDEPVTVVVSVPETAVPEMLAVLEITVPETADEET